MFHRAANLRRSSINVPIMKICTKGIDMNVMGVMKGIASAIMDIGTKKIIKIIKNIIFSVDFELATSV